VRSFATSTGGISRDGRDESRCSLAAAGFPSLAGAALQARIDANRVRNQSRSLSVTQPTVRSPTARQSLCRPGRGQLRTGV
jgi:hypothetical protein